MSQSSLSGSVNPLILFFSKDFGFVFALLDPFHFHMRFKISVPISTSPSQKPPGIFIGIVLNLQINLEITDIVTISSLPTHRQSKSLRLLRSSFISLINILWFSIYRYYPSFVRFIPKYFLVLCYYK